MESFPTRGSPDPWRLSIDAAERLVADVVLLRRTRVPTLGGSVLWAKAAVRQVTQKTWSRSFPLALLWTRRAASSRVNRSDVILLAKRGTVDWACQSWMQDLRAFIERLAFTTRVVVVTFLVVLAVVLLFDFEFSSLEISRLLTWAPPVRFALSFDGPG